MADLDATADLLWRAKPVKEARPRLSADMIVGVAVSIADDEGLAALSMQRVAKELGCTSMALYRYVTGKDELVTAMADTAMGRPPAPSGDDWRAEVEGVVEAMWRMFLAHPWVARVPATSAPLGPNGLAWFEALLAPLSRTSLDRAELIPMATFVTSAVRDLARVQHDTDAAAAADYGRVLARRVTPYRFPVLMSLLGAPEESDVTPVVTIGLRRLLAGITG